jgi:hypothetical protein
MVAGPFCTALFSLCSTKQVPRKNLATHLHFLLLPQCDCIEKIANNIVWEATFENKMLGFGGANLIFSVMEKKRAGQCGYKMSDGKVRFNPKYVPHTCKNNLLTVVHTSVPPITIITSTMPD